MKKLFAFCLLASFAFVTSAFAAPLWFDENGNPVTNPCVDYKLQTCTAKATCKSCTFNGKTKYKIVSCAKGYEIASNGCKRCVAPTSKGWVKSCPQAAICKDIWECGGLAPRFKINGCKDGYYLLDGQCEKAKLVCTPGYVLINGKCVKK